MCNARSGWMGDQRAEEQRLTLGTLKATGYSLKWVFWVKNQFLKTKVFSKFLTQKAPFRHSKSPLC